MSVTKMIFTAQESKVALYTFYFVLAFAVAYFFGAHEGVYYSDDIHYSEFAGRLINGTFDIRQNGHTFIHRPTVFVPTAIIYTLLGVNFFTYSLWPFCCTVGCLFIAFKSAHQHNLNPAYAVIFLGFTFYFIYFINFLYPDNIVAFLTLVSASVYFNVYKGDFSQLLPKAVVATCSLFAAGLAKETAAIFLPFFLFLAIRDIMRGGNKQTFWLYCIAISAVLLILYFGWYYSITGDPFYRISEMERANLAYDNYITNGNRTYFKRLLWGPIEALIGTGTFILLVFSLSDRNQLVGQERKEKLFWLLLFLTSYLVLNFASTSLKVYNPIALDARMYNLVIPPLAIAASYGFQKRLSNIKYTAAYTIIFSFTAIYLNNKVSVIYVLLALYFALHTFWLYGSRITLLLPYTALAAITLALAIRPLYFSLKDKTLYYNEHKELINTLQLSSASERKTLQVLVPDYLFHSRNYFFEYKESNGIRLIPYSVADSTTRSAKFILINHNLNQNSSFHQSGPYEHITDATSTMQLHWKSGPLELYGL